MNEKRTDKKTIIKMLISAAILAALLCFFKFFQTDNRAYSTNIYAMDTVMSILIYGDSDGSVATECIKEIQRLDKLFSTGDFNSDISKINRDKALLVSDDTYELVKKALETGDETDGAFDISIYPVMKAWGFDSKEYRVISKEEAKEMTDRVNYKNISIYAGFEYVDSFENIEKSSYVKNEGLHLISIPDDMEIDLGGIAKGYTAGKIAEILNRNKIKSARLNLGGNILVYGSKPDKSLWSIGIQDPVNSEGYIGIVSVCDKSVVTSGGYQRYFEENGEIYHHIINPTTGYPAKAGLISVTIVSADATLADAYSTSLYVMGLEKATEFWRSNKETFDAVLMDSDGKVYITGGLENSFSSDYEYIVIR